MSESAKSFFESLRHDFPDSVLPDGVKLPVDIGRSLLTEEEMEAECLDWCVQFLNSRRCPPTLAMLITRDVVPSAVEIAHEKMKELIAHIDPILDPHGESPDFVGHQKFGRLVCNELLRVCRTWELNNQPVIEEPMPAEVFVHAIKNTRRKMEDKHVILPIFGKLFQGLGALSYYAVFDGHGGSDAAKYAAVHLHSLLGRRLQTQSPKEALHEAFLETDRMFVTRANRERTQSGSTAVCVLVERNLLHVAWLGDSQALLVRDGKPIKLVTPHKPEDEAEKKRIEECGGYVVFLGAWRVNGSLSVSRAIGDAFHKPCVSGEPDIETFPYETGDWLVLACDGLWDQLSHDDVAAMIAADVDPSTAAQRLVNEAKDRGSGDNITAIVARLTVPPNVEGRGTDPAADPNRTLEMKVGEKDRSGGSGPKADPAAKTSSQEGSAFGHETVASSSESSHLAMKRLAESELEVSDDDQLTDSGSSDDVQRSSSQGSRQNFLHLSKVLSLEDAALTAAVVAGEFSPSSSGLSDVARTTSEDTSGQSPDPSLEAGATEMRVANMHKRSKQRRAMAGWQHRQKENRRPSDDRDPAGATPPCLRAGSPLLCEEGGASSFSESCRSLSLASGSGTLGHSAAALRGAATVRMMADGRGRIASLNAPSRWTIAVEVDADVGMFEEIPGVIAGGPSAMNLSSHW